MTAGCDESCGMSPRSSNEAARRTKRARQRLIQRFLKVLFITGYAENAVVRHGHLERDMHVMMKPFTLEALANRVKEIIARPFSQGQ